jgi:hypothetical protein
VRTVKLKIRNKILKLEYISYSGNLKKLTAKCDYPEKPDALPVANYQE